MSKKNTKLHAMPIEMKTFLTPECTCFGVKLDSKKRLLQLISELAANSLGEEVNSKDILDGIIARERLGSTYLGHGVALPHTRSNAVNKPIACLIVLEDPINFGRAETQSTDIIFAFIAPDNGDETHLQTLKSIASRLHESRYRKSLRQATDSIDLYKRAI